MRNWSRLLIIFLVCLIVDKQVAALQADLDTTGTVTLTIDTALGKSLSYNRLANGKLRILISGMNATTFTGVFATVDATVVSITGVVGATAAAKNANATVTKLAVPANPVVKAAP